MIPPNEFRNPVLIQGQGGMVFSPYWQKQLDKVVNAINALTANTDAYTTSNVVASRTLDAGAATLAQTRQVLGTLLEDLQSKAILS